MTEVNDTVRIQVEYRPLRFVATMTIASWILLAGPISAELGFGRTSAAASTFALSAAIILNFVAECLIFVGWLAFSALGLIAGDHPLSLTTLIALGAASPIQWYFLERLIRRRFGARREAND